MKKSISHIIFFCIIFIFSSAQAHNIYLEEQARYDYPIVAPPESDASFANPFILVDDVRQSQAIFAYLTRGDVDVFQFTISPQDLVTGPVIVTASALPPACKETLRNFPVTALVGPGLPPPRPGLHLPFEVPVGYGVLYADNPKPPHGVQREIFNLEEGSASGISWFLPVGLSEDCLFAQPFPTCDFSNTIFTPVFVPGVYQIVIWDPKGKAQDYTANIGLSEEDTVENPVAECQVKANRHLHRRCRLPYNDICTEE